MDKKIVINLYLWSAFTVLTGQMYSILIARNISVENFGKYALLTQIMLFILPMNTLGIQRVIRIMNSKGDYIPRELVNMGLNFTFITSFLVVPVWTYLYFAFTDLEYYYWIFIFLASFWLSIWSVVTVIFELDDKWIQRQQLLFYYSLLNLIILYILIKFRLASASVRLVTVGVTSLLLGLLLITKYKIIDKTTLSFSKYMAPDRRVGLPLALISMSDNLFLIIDKNLIIQRLGDFANGIYSAHLILFSLMVLGYAPLSTYLENFIFRSNTKSKYWHIVIAILLIGSIGIYYLAPKLFNLLYGRKYEFEGGLLLTVYFIALLKIARDILRIYLSKIYGILPSALVNIIGLIILNCWYFDTVGSFLRNVLIIYSIIFLIDLILLYGKRNYSGI